MTTEIIHVRDGQTVCPPQARPPRCAAVPLDHLGIRQAKAAARSIADYWTPSAINTSPLNRADQTTSEIAALTAERTPRSSLWDVDYGGVRVGCREIRLTFHTRPYLDNDHLT
jgi:broad specificity phosphatase PhoE